MTLLALQKMETLVKKSLLWEVQYMSAKKTKTPETSIYSNTNIL